jgi:PTS system nitrogen regulatory IIA component
LEVRNDGKFFTGKSPVPAHGGLHPFNPIYFVTMYLNLIQIAESFGVSESVVEGWIRNEGLPCTPDRGRLLFDRAQVTEWAAERGLGARAGFLAPADSALTTHLRVASLLRAGGIWRDVAAAEVLEVFARIITALPGATPPVRQLLSQRVRARGGVTMAPVGGGFALPHPSARITLGRDSGTVALLLLRDDLALPEPPPDGVPVRRLFFFIAPSPRGHLDLLARLSRSLVQGSLRELVESGAPDQEIFQAIEKMDAVVAEGQP